MPKLRPCPWCGEKPTDPYPDDDDGLVICRCTKSPDWRMPVCCWNEQRGVAAAVEQAREEGVAQGARLKEFDDKIIEKAVAAERERCESVIRPNCIDCRGYDLPCESCAAQTAAIRAGVNE